MLIISALWKLRQEDRGQLELHSEILYGENLTKRGAKRHWATFLGSFNELVLGNPGDQGFSAQESRGRLQATEQPARKLACWSQSCVEGATVAPLNKSQSPC